MNEEQTRHDLIDPALKEAGWGIFEGSRIKVEVITKGRLLGGGKKSKFKKADYVLEYKNHKLAVLEAKSNEKKDTEGLGQAKEYAQMLQTRFAFSTNGIGIYKVDMKTGEEGYIDNYPSPDELWQQTFKEENKWRNNFAQVPFEDKGGTWETRYYQHNAITNVLESIAQGNDRLLLTLATGTGKTSIAFQIAWKLYKSRWNIQDKPNRHPRILFLADRNILADQAFNAFSAFPEDALIRIDPSSIKKKGKVPTNGSIFFTIFQTFMTGYDDNGNPSPNFGEYPPDFFDFIVIDECHRGGANDESTWRAILNYFAPAVQLGLTATPKRTNNVDTYAYFGEPVYVYSLKEGINDGYLTPFRVKQIETTIDEYVYTSDDIVKKGIVKDGEAFCEDDFNKVIEIKEREEHRVKLFLSQVNQKEKSIIFCANQNHALAIRDLINQQKESSDPNYCHRVTANDGKVGEQHLRTFQDNEKTIPTILTTSHKLSTGVDARNVRNIVLMRPITSMIEFKQIIGRGTRLFEGKDYFTIYDFVKAHTHFADEQWDGEPMICPICEKDPCACTQKPRQKPCSVCGYMPCICQKPPKEPCPKCGKRPCECGKKEMIEIELADGKKRKIQNMMSTTFWSPDGTPISASQFITKLFGDLPELFKNESELRKIWSQPDTRKGLLQELTKKGYGDEQLDEIRKIIDAEKSDIFDVLAYVAYHKDPITRLQRVETHHELVFQEYDETQQEFLQFVLDQYIKEGVKELDNEKLPVLLTLKYGGLQEAKQQLGDINQIRNVFIGFQKHLYEKKAA